MADERPWYYRRTDANGFLSAEYYTNVLRHVSAEFRKLPPNVDTIRCPCTRCRDRFFIKDEETVCLHLLKHGFKRGLKLDESGEGSSQNDGNVASEEALPVNPNQTMVENNLGHANEVEGGTDAQNPNAAN